MMISSPSRGPDPRKITTPRRLGIMGGSNGGLLMGAMLNRHPELFRAVVIQVPLLDMLRYIDCWPGRPGWPNTAIPTSRRGRVPAKYLALPQSAAGMPYPELFFVTSTKDDRVHPGHARKMAAKMEAMGLPFLYYENTDGGHAAAAKLQERAGARRWSSPT